MKPIETLDDHPLDGAAGAGLVYTKIPGIDGEVGALAAKPSRAASRRR